MRFTAGILGRIRPRARPYKPRVYPATQRSKSRRLRLPVEASGGLGDFAGLDATRANFHPFGAAAGRFYADRLQVGIENTRGPIIGVRDIIAKLWAFAANFTTFCHDD